MIRQIFIFLLILLMSGCSITYVNAPKKVCLHGDKNEVVITGSDLKGNDLKQTSSFDWILQIPETMATWLGELNSKKAGEENTNSHEEKTPALDHRSFGGDPIVKKD